MALPSTGELSLSVINVELGAASTAQRSLNDAALRTLFGIVTAGAQISLSDGRGKSSTAKLTIAAHQKEMNLRTWAIANGWNGTSAVEITVAAGVYIWSDNVAIPAMRIDGAWPGGLVIVNNGFIMGKGGKGATSSASVAGCAAQSGGPAIVSTVAFSINSSAGYIGGGGGGGASRVGYNEETGWYGPMSSGGGGAGGGAGGDYYNDVTGNLKYWMYGGAGGSIGAPGADSPQWDGTFAAGGGGGGRIMPGSRTAGYQVDGADGQYSRWSGKGGTAGGTGASTAAINYKGDNPKYICAGYGGGPAEAGQSMHTGVNYNSGTIFGAGGGGGWGAAGGAAGTYSNVGDSNDIGYATSYGLGGAAISASGNAITWIGGFPSGRVFGAVL